MMTFYSFVQKVERAQRIRATWEISTLLEIQTPLLTTMNPGQKNRHKILWQNSIFFALNELKSS